MLDITVSGDYREVDKVMNRLVRGLNPRTLNSLAARTAWKQVKTKYSRRFSSQTRHDSIWQSIKTLLGVGSRLPFGPRPGFLTGTTFSSIGVVSDSTSGKVYLHGRWPKSSGVAMEESMTQEEYTGQKNFDEKRAEGRGWKWCDGYESAWGLEYHSGVDKPQYYPSQALESIEYGKDTGRRINFLYLDNEDIGIVTEKVRNFLEFLIDGNYAGIKALFASTRLAMEDASYMFAEDEFIEEAGVEETAGEIFSTSSGDSDGYMKSLKKLVDKSGAISEMQKKVLSEAEEWMKKNKGKF